MTALLLSAVVAATTVKAIGVVIAVVTGIGVVGYILVNLRQGRPEIGAEIELAPNRKPYFDDEALEGPRLNRALLSGLVLIAITAVGLPLYWLNEPGRQSRRDRELRPDLRQPREPAVRAHRGRWVQLRRVPRVRGRRGTGAAVHAHRRRRRVRRHRHLAGPRPQHRAPAVLDGGAARHPRLRPTGHADAAVGHRGRRTAHLPADRRADRVHRVHPDHLATRPRPRSTASCGTSSASSESADIDWDDPATGQALFNLGLENGFAGGAYSCGRCHTKGASFEYGPVEPEDADLSDYMGFPDGSGAFGWTLTGGVIPRQFLSIQDLMDFIDEGTRFGLLYGQRGQGTGRMPGFGDNPDDPDDLDDDLPGDGMFTAEMICSVAKYEASLGADAQPIIQRCEQLAEELDPATTTTTEPGGGGGSADEEAEE